jgi:hypothetical protein
MNSLAISSIAMNLVRFMLRYIRRLIELPALMVFGILVLLIWFLLTASANEAGRSIAAFFTHYFVEIPLGTPIDMDNVSLDISQMMRLFTIWGTIYFIITEAVSWLIRRLTGRVLPHSRLVLLALILVGYAGLIGLYELHRQIGASLQGVVGVAMFLILIAAASLGISYAIMRLERHILLRSGVREELRH